MPSLGGAAVRVSDRLSGNCTITLSHSVVLLGSAQGPQQAKADGHLSKRRAEVIHDYLAGLKFRLYHAGAFGRFFEWYSVRILHIIERDRQHARCELEYLRHLIERAV